MSRVTPATIDHVARLARLSLTADERDTFARQLDQVLDYAESIQALDTTGVEPIRHAGEAATLRDDAPQPGLAREEAVGAAPDADADAGLFRVPRVLGG